MLLDQIAQTTCRIQVFLTVTRPINGFDRPHGVVELLGWVADQVGESVAKQLPDLIEQEDSRISLSIRRLSDRLNRVARLRKSVDRIDDQEASKVGDRRLSAFFLPKPEVIRSRKAEVNKVIEETLGQAEVELNIKPADRASSQERERFLKELLTTYSQQRHSLGDWRRAIAATSMNGHGH